MTDALRDTRRGAARAALAALVFAAGLVSACASDCKDETEAAQQFLTTATNLSCQADADCVVVSTGCGHPARATCGQAQLNRTAAASGYWKKLQSALTDCESDCAQCLVGLVPACGSGFCGGAP
ncbi:MAG TPA: hypothetical protein VGJ91_00490 [Polyangiaceae bacterium]